MTCIEGDFPAFVVEGSMEAGVVMITTGELMSGISPPCLFHGDSLFRSER
jgi:hypothetical protein